MPHQEAPRDQEAQAHHNTEGTGWCCGSSTTQETRILLEHLGSAVPIASCYCIWSQQTTAQILGFLPPTVGDLCGVLGGD